MSDTYGIIRATSHVAGERSDFSYHFDQKYRNSGDFVDAESFVHTHETLFLTANCDGVTAYGVVYNGIGVSGPGFRTVTKLTSWDWYQDPNEARDESLFRLWKASDDFTEIDNLPFPKGILNKDIQAIHVHKCKILGHEFEVYRRLSLELFGSKWNHYIKRDDALAAVREQFFDIFNIRNKKNPIKFADARDIRIPDLTKKEFYHCPELGAPLYAWCVYTLSNQNPVLEPKWVRDESEALEILEETINAVDRQIQIQKEKEDLQLAREIYNEAFDKWQNLYQSARWITFSSLLPTDTIDAFNYPLEDDVDYDSSEKLLEAAEVYGKVAEEMEIALNTVETERTKFVQKEKIPEILRALLTRHIETCQICGEKIRVDDAWLLETAILGKNRLQCACPETGWDFRSDETPMTADILRRESFDLRSVDQIASLDSDVILDEVKEQSSNSRLLCIVGGTDNCRPFGKIVINDAAIADHADGKSIRTDFWRRNLKTLKAHKIASANESVASGGSIVLQFHTQTHKGKSQIQATTKVGGTTTVWVLQDKLDSNLEVVPGKSYYCRNCSTRHVSQDGRFKLVTVVPYLEYES